MAIKGGNKSDKKVISTRSLFTGLGNWKIIAINPNEEERKALEITQKVGDYTATDEKDNPQTRLDIWVKLVGIPIVPESSGKVDFIKNFPLQKLSLFLTNKELLSGNDNTMWINKLGITSWAKTPEAIQENSNMDWFNSEDLRPAIQGEDQLTQLIAAWLNVDKREEGAECRLEDAKKIADGKVKELKDILKAWKDNTVQLLLMVKVAEKGKFQEFFKDFFGRPSVKTVEAWQKAIGDERNGLSATRYSNYKLSNKGLEFGEYQVSTQVEGGSEDHSHSNADQTANDGFNIEEEPPF